MTKSSLGYGHCVNLLDRAPPTVFTRTGVGVDEADHVHLAALGQLAGLGSALKPLGALTKGQHGVPVGSAVVIVHGQGELPDQRTVLGGAKAGVATEGASQLHSFWLSIIGLASRWLGWFEDVLCGRLSLRHLQENTSHPLSGRGRGFGGTF